MSIRWRLVLGYAVIIAWGIGALGVILVKRTRSELINAVDRELLARAKAIGSVIEFEDGGWRIDPESTFDHEYEKDRRVYYVVREGPPMPGREDFDRPRGPVVLESQFARPDTWAPISHERDRWVDGVHVREASWRGMPRDHWSPGERRPETSNSRLETVVTCGMDMAATDGFIKELISQFLILGPLAVLASLAVGWAMISRSLRPIDEMALTARRISETDLSRRIPVTTRDELGRLGDTLNATFERIQKGFERERRFTADASHELRTPLAVVTGNVEVALNKDRPPAEYRQMLGDIGEAAARMQTIVEGLLALARVDRHTPPRDRHPVALAPLCEDVVRLHRPIAERAGVSLDLATEPNIELKADAEALKTVVSNLVSNAIRYNQYGGRVAIGVERENGVVRIRVEDTGIGIPKEHLPHVLERFYRVDPARTAASGGAGLGLAIANAIVAAHHGTIAIESEPGRGTKVEVRLPG